MDIVTVTLITLHVLNNLFAQTQPPMLSESAVYVYRIQIELKSKRNLISVKCGAGYCTPKTTIPYQTPSPLHFMISFQS